MIITEARVDDRLIHGQVVTTWVQNSGAQAILVADDAAAADEFQQSMLQLACPKNIQLVILPVAKAIKLYKKDPSVAKTMLIVRNPATARALAEGGLAPDHWTIGNITGRKSDLERHNVLKYLFPTQADADDIKAISDAGIKVFAQSVPNETQYDCVDLLKKSGLI